MSSTNRGGERCAADNYPTPAWCVHRFLEECPLPGGHWFEPSAGEGAIITAVDEVRSDVEWDAMDIRQEAVAALLAHPSGLESVLLGDFLTHQFHPGRFDVILGNPPFADAEAFVRRCLTLARYTALLLRLNFLGSESRAPFWRENAPDVYVLPNRPAFVNGKTDSCEYAWFVWPPEKRASGIVRVLATTPKEVRCRRAA